MKYIKKMEKKPLISVIVPIYNVEIYLNRCIQSLLNQTWKNIEIILVEDGSPDNSGIICDQWAQKDDRIKVVHKKNGGVSSARNAGLRIAKGDYFGFVDPDDYIEKDMYEFLYNQINERDCDIAVCDCDTYLGNLPEEQVKVADRSSFYFNDVLDSKRAVGRELYYGLFITCNKLIKRSVCKDLFYNENMINGEDRLFAIDAVLHSKKVSYNLEPKYHYCHRENSAGSKNFSPKDFNLIEVSKIICEMTSQNAPESSSFARGHLTKSYLQIFLMLEKTPSDFEEYRVQVIKDLRKRFPVFLFEKNPVKTKLTVLCLVISPGFYRSIKNLYKKVKDSSR